MLLDLDALTPVVDAATATVYAAFRRSLSRVGFDPYYSEAIARFELRDGDVLVAPRDVRAEPAGCGVRLVSESAQARLEVCGLTAAEACAALGAVDGVRTAAEVRRVSGVAPGPWRNLVTAAFGTLLFTPFAVAALEARASGVELVRFVGSPYEIVRTYWENMGSVALWLRASESDPSLFADVAAFVHFLRQIHALSLVGESGRSLYRPASAILDKPSPGVGEFLREPSVVEGGSSGSDRRFVSGPRVGASLIGGVFYHRLLAERLSDPEALAESRIVEDESALEWGRLVTARADADLEDAPWFCPPRPLSERHFEALRSSLVEARSANGEGAAPALARFHWSFVRLHPFAFANQCVAMSLVNHVLRRTHGGGLPHHVLDHLALRLSLRAYTAVFQLAVSEWLVPAGDKPVQRTLELMDRKRRAFDVLRELGAAPSLDAARQVAAVRAADARLALLG